MVYDQSINTSLDTSKLPQAGWSYIGWKLNSSKTNAIFLILLVGIIFMQVCIGKMILTECSTKKETIGILIAVNVVIMGLTGWLVFPHTKLPHIKLFGKEYNSYNNTSRFLGRNAVWRLQNASQRFSTQAAPNQETSPMHLEVPATAPRADFA